MKAIKKTKASKVSKKKTSKKAVEKKSKPRFSLKAELAEIEKEKERISSATVDEYVKMKKLLEKKFPPMTFQVKYTLLELVSLEFTRSYKDGEKYLLVTLEEILKHYRKS